jgi:hypothetical protein
VVPVDVDFSDCVIKLPVIRKFVKAPTRQILVSDVIVSPMAQSQAGLSSEGACYSPSQPPVSKRGSDKHVSVVHMHILPK